MLMDPVMCKISREQMKACPDAHDQKIPSMLNKKRELHAYQN